MNTQYTGPWSVGYFRHDGKIQRAENFVDYWYHSTTIEDATDTARWLVGALGADPTAAADSERELAEIRTPHLPAGGGVGWRVGPYDVVLTDGTERNKTDALNPMGRLLMVAQDIHAGQVDLTVSGYAARAGYDLTAEVQTLLAWDIAELSGAHPRLSDKGRAWVLMYGDWKVTWYRNFGDLPHPSKYFRGGEAEARAYAERLAGKWPSVALRSPLGTRDIIASDVQDIR